MSAAIPSTVGTPQQPPAMPTNLTPAQLQAYQAQQAQNLFRQRQLIAQQQQIQMQMQQQNQQHIQQQQQQQQQLQLQHQQQQQHQHHHQQQQQNPNQYIHQQTPFPQHQQTPNQQVIGTPPVMSSPATANVMTPSKIAVVPRNQSNGQAVLRLLQFAEQLNPGGEQATERSFWDTFVDDFFTDRSTMKMGLFNTEENLQQAYEVGQALIARFFHTQYMCGVISMQMTLEQTMEYILPGGIMNVECPRASLINKFDNGSLVVSTGHLWVQFLTAPDGSWKIGHMDFSCQGHEEFVARVSIKVEHSTSKKKNIQHFHIPESPINKWGVPPRVYHILQISDIGPRLSEIVFHSLISEATPRQSLNAIAFDKRQELVKRNNGTSPIVRTQNGNDQSSPQVFAMSLPRQQQQYQTPTYQTQQAYPNQFNPQQQQQQTPVGRKRNSIASDIQSPVARKKAARKQQQQQQQQ